MSAAAVSTAEQAYLEQLLGRMLPNWLSGFAGAWDAWRDPEQSPPAVRAAVEALAAALTAMVDPALIPPTLDPEVFRVQVLNILRWGKGPDGGPAIRTPAELLAAAGRIMDVEPPRRQEGRSGPIFPSCYDPAAGKNPWERPHVGLFGGPVWDVMVPAWEHLTPEVRAALDRHVDAVPAGLTSPAAFAWLDRVTPRELDQLRGVAPDACPRPLEYGRRVVAYRTMTDEEAERLTILALDQHDAWIPLGIFRDNRHDQDLDRVAPDFLNRFGHYHGSFARALHPRLAERRVQYRGPFYRPLRPSAKEPCFFDGYALVPLAEAGSPATPGGQAVFAALADPLEVENSPVPLIVVLDLDLARAELAFLGLSGSRLRICDWPSHLGTPCFTHVTLDGGVSLVDEDDADNLIDDDGSEPFEASELLVLGPAFASPVADMPELGWNGWGWADARIGGSPGWEQEPEWPRSPIPGPRKQRPHMTFLAQFPHPDGGKAFAFLDPANLIAAVLRQYD